MTDYPFGFVDFSESVSFNVGEIIPLDSFPEARRDFSRRISGDGFLYPNWSWFRDSFEGPVPDRPWNLHKLPASHSVMVEPPTEDDEPRKTLAGFAIHLFGFLFGYRVQFEDWWVDGRVHGQASNDLRPRAQQVGLVISRGLETWHSLNQRDRQVLTNALFLYGRTRAYFWDWEHFQAEYQVLDALYAVGARLHGLHAKRHRDRIKALCDKFGLAWEEERVSQLVRHRNDLVHEALWAGQMPTSGAGDDMFRLPFHLHRLNTRLVLALIGVRAAYIETAWWRLGSERFWPE